MFSFIFLFIFVLSFLHQVIFLCLAFILIGGFKDKAPVLLPQPGHICSCIFPGLYQYDKFLIGHAPPRILSPACNDARKLSAPYGNAPSSLRRKPGAFHNLILLVSPSVPGNIRLPFYYPARTHHSRYVLPPAPR